MDKLPPDAAELLALLRSVDDPTPEERRRADAGLRSTLAAHGVRTLPSLPLPAANASKPLGALVKWLWAGAALLMLGLGFWGAHTWRAAVRTVPPPVSQPAPRLEPALPPLAAAPSQLDPVVKNERPPPRALPHSAKVADDTLAEELRFIASVDADIREGGFDKALQRLSHRKAYSPLKEERAAMTVLALCGRDHDAAAARARDQFLKRSPSSLLAARVRAACKDGL